MLLKNKSIEITAIPDLLDLIDISNCIVTIHAIECQKNIAEKIINKSGHYCLAVKNNQKILYTEFKGYFDFALNNKEEQKEIYEFIETNKNHGRIERREHYVTYNTDFIYGKEKWKNLKLIGMTRNYRQINDGFSIQEKYYISDLQLSSEGFSRVTRGHWSIENNLHWILDVHFREDWIPCKDENAFKNLSVIKKNLL